MPEVAILVTAKDQASATLGKVGGSLSKLGKAAAVAGAVGVAAVGAIAVGVTKLAVDAAKLEPTRITFDNLTKSIGTTADAMLKKLRPATMGVLSDAELMKAANKLMAMGLAETTEEAADLSEMAVTMGMAMGTEAGPALENFTLMLANQSIPRMDTFGLSSGKARQRINELMEATQDMTREEAFKIAVMEQGAAAMAKVGDISATSAVTMKQFSATVTNLKMTVGNALLPVLKKFLDLVAIPLMNKMQELGTEIGKRLGPFMSELATKHGPMVSKILGKVGEVVQKVGGFIANTLIPAIVRLVRWLVDNLGPIFREFAEQMAPRFQAVLETIGTFIRDTLVPALQRFWEATEGIREAIVAFMGSSAVTGLKIFLEGLILLWDGIAASLRAVWEILGWIIDRIRSIIDLFRGWELPPWLRPRSVTPFEKALRGIADAFEGFPPGVVLGMGQAGTMTHQWGGGPAVVRIEGFPPEATEQLQDRMAEAILEMLYPGR